MISAKFGKTTVQVPSRWSDFTPQLRTVFIDLCGVMDLLERDAITYNQFRALSTIALLGVDRDKVSHKEEKQDIFFENIFRLSDLLTFTHTLRPADKEGQVVALTISLCSQLLPTLEQKDGKIIEGYRMGLSPEGIVECTITAEQYTDALGLVEMYSKTRTESSLRNLTRILYPSADLTQIHEKDMIAVYYNFRGILEWVRNLPQYQVLFVSTGKPKGTPTPLGAGGSIFALAKSGYGTLREIRELDMFSYLSALVQMSADSIRQLASAGLKASAISDKMSIPVEIVSDYMPND